MRTTPTSAAGQRELLRGHLAEIVPDDDERDWLEPRLAVLLGGEDSYSREDLFAAWLTWFERRRATGATRWPG